jgi:chromosome segregation ATPase
MIDDMVKLLGKEQYDDDLRQEVCVEDLDKAEDKLKTTEASIKNIEGTIAEDKDLIKTAEDDIDSLKKGIKKLDKDVTDATETRKEEHDEYEATLVENKAAKDLLLLAENRLNKFYNPTLYKAAPKEEVSRDEQIAANLGVSFLQVGFHAASKSARAEPAPEALGAYKAKDPEKSGVLEMIGMLITDLDTEIKEQEAAEKDAQADYESFMEDSAAKRTKDGKSISKKERTEAELEAELAKLRAKDKAKLREAYATTGVLGDLHQDCDWLLTNYETRKKARVAEKESLAKAKGILSGMDVSLVQTAHKSNGFLKRK